MAKLHSQFIKFHANIKLGRFDEEEILREKRDAVLKKLKAGLKADFEARGEEYPAYTTMDQGSYAMGTGIKPLDGDYDIDIALMFEVSKDDYGPLDVKGWVFDAVDEHTDNVEIKNSCVTVQYQNKGEPIYHVDLGVFSAHNSNFDGNSYIAKGRAGALAKNQFWKQSDPEKLENTLMERYSGDDKKQFIRCIRYLKRWKDKNFASASSNGKPSGIALTVLAYDYFQANRSMAPLVQTYQYDDLAALRDLALAIKNSFSALTWDSDERDFYLRAQAKIPVAPFDDLLRNMSRIQMQNFKSKVDSLVNSLEKAQAEPDPTKAAESLVTVFGDDFPVPEKSETAEKRSPAIIGSTSAA